MIEAEKTHSYKKQTASTQPRVVIVGGGFGGLYAARALAGAPVSVTLIDKRNYHLFRPLLYQVATGLLSADEISGPLRSILSRQNMPARYCSAVRTLVLRQTQSVGVFA